MRRIKLLIMSVSMLMFTGLALSTLNAQTTTFQTNSQGDNSAAASSAGIHDLGGTGIDAGTITSTVKEAMVYAKSSLEAVSNGKKGYSGVKKDIALSYYSDFLMNLSNTSGQTSTEVAYALAKTFNVLHVKVSGLPNGSSYLSFLENLAEDTVNDLQ